MAEKKDQLYSATEACEALGLKRTTFDAWMLRGYLKLGGGPGTGRTRLLLFEAIVRLAIMKVCSDLGVMPNRSANWVSIAINEINHDPNFQFLNIRRYPSTEEAGPKEWMTVDDDLMEETPPPPGAEVLLRLDVRGIVDRVRKALDSIAADNG